MTELFIVQHSLYILFVKSFQINSCAHLRTCPYVCSQSCAPCMVRSPACTLCLLSSVWRLQWHCTCLSGSAERTHELATAAKHWHTARRRFLLRATFKHSIPSGSYEKKNVMWLWGGSWQNGSALTKLLYSVCCAEIGIAIGNYLSDLSNISMGIIQCKIPIQGYVARNYSPPQVVVYYHHPTADWFRNLPHWSWHVVLENVYQMLLLGTGCDFHQSTTVYHGQAVAVIVFQLNPLTKQAKYENQRFLLTI